jgi:hypothetical protein
VLGYGGVICIFISNQPRRRKMRKRYSFQRDVTQWTFFFFYSFFFYVRAVFVFRAKSCHRLTSPRAVPRSIARPANVGGKSNDVKRTLRGFGNHGVRQSFSARANNRRKPYTYRCVSRMVRIHIVVAYNIMARFVPYAVATENKYL